MAIAGEGRGVPQFGADDNPAICVKIQDYARRASSSPFVRSRPPMSSSPGDGNKHAHNEENFIQSLIVTKLRLTQFV